MYDFSKGPKTMTEKAFDPRDFISPPFKTCPRCGHETFGVLTISKGSYSRRCRDCWHMVKRIPLPPVRKKIIYLDQYVVSNLMKLDNPTLQRTDKLAANPFWQELRDLLTELRDLQLIVCPDSTSHVSESRISPFNAELKKTYEHLSGGITFNSFSDISNSQIGELARAWSEQREPIFNFDPCGVLSDDPNKWNDRFYITFHDNPFVIPTNIKAARAMMHAHVAHLFHDVWSQEKRSFQDWYDLERKGFQGHLGQAVVKARRERAEAMLAFRPGVEPSLEVLGKFLGSPEEALCEGLRRIMLFPRTGGERTPEEVAALEKSFGEANRIAEAPFVKFQAMMFAAIAMLAAGGKKEPPNEGMTTDIETVAHLLPYCDAMFMDNECRSLLLNVPLALRPPEASRVYSLNNSAEFLEYLRSLRADLTPEHIQALRDVYGEDGVAE
jgi:hypothetical protein